MQVERKPMMLSTAVRGRLWDRYSEDRVRRAVEQAIDAEGFCKTDAQRVRAKLKAWIDDDIEVAEFMDLPTGEVIARICEGLGCALDWELWRGEIWAVDYMGPELSLNLYAMMSARAEAAGLLRHTNANAYMTHTLASRLVTSLPKSR
jgi:hypothetical protein